MPDGRTPGPMCQVQKPLDVSDGTMCRAPSPAPGPIGFPAASMLPEVIVTEPARAAINSGVVAVAELSWDSFVRKLVYEPAARAIREQGDDFVRRGILSSEKAAAWVVAQRNALVIAVRDGKNSPLGRALSEWLKPRSDLPTLASEYAKRASKLPGASADEVFTAVIRGGAKTRGWVNKFGFALRGAGPAAVVLNITLSGYLIAEAPPEQRGRVAAREAGGLVGGTAGGIGGAALGCKIGGAVGVWFGGAGAVPGCAIGAVVFGVGLGYGGSRLGSAFGELTFDATTAVVEWVEEP